MERALSQSGYSLLLCNSDRSLEKESDYVRILLENGVDGVILDSAASDCDGQLRSLDNKGVPACAAVAPSPVGANAMAYSSITGTAPARQRLICSRAAGALLFINGPADLSQSRQRLARAWTMRCRKTAYQVNAAPYMS